MPAVPMDEDVPCFDYSPDTSLAIQMASCNALAREYPRYLKIPCLMGPSHDCWKAKGYLKPRL